MTRTITVPSISTRVGENENTKVVHVSQKKAALRLVVQLNMKGRRNTIRNDSENIELNIMKIYGGDPRLVVIFE